MAADDTGFLTDWGDCCESASVVDDCGVCHGDGRSCARLLQGSLSTREGDDGSAVLGILQVILPGVDVTLEHFQEQDELMRLQSHAQEGTVLSTRGLVNGDTMNRALQNSAGQYDGNPPASVTFRVGNEGSVIYSSEDLAAAFVRATSVAADRGILDKASLLPAVSVQVCKQLASI